MNIIAHRGNFKPEGPIPTINFFDIPENSLESFKNALQNGFGIETDVRQTEDNEFVLLHDENLLKFSKNNLEVSQLTLKEIKTQLNGKFSVSSLDDLASLARKYTITNERPFIAFQIKPGSNFEAGFAVASILEAYKLTNCIIFDTTIDVAEKLRQQFPWLNLSVSLGEKNYSPTIYTPEEVFSDRFSTVYNCVWADEWKEERSIYNQDMFKKIKNYYSRLDVISPELHILENHPLSKDVNKAQSLWKEIISWNVADGICTDYPSLLQSIIHA
ncbi:MAG TPA: glycerophosphodiester phosphodiesterase family protein [Patescibacteria group bacterium]